MEAMRKTATEVTAAMVVMVMVATGNAVKDSSAINSWLIQNPRATLLEALPHSEDLFRGR